jgi:hypothetical protein
MTVFLGIARECVYSPGKVEDDQAILDAVAECLAQRHCVRTVSAEEPLVGPDPETIVFTMCQGPAALETIRTWEAAGIRVINSADSIENCHRHRMLPALDRMSVNCPPSVIIPTNGAGVLPEWIAEGAWLKRGDVHATQAGDVVFVREPKAARETLRDFCQRGISRAMVQRHVEGTVIKFYAVRNGFLAWFPEKPLALPESEVDALRALANAGAVALGLDIFGGDCVRAADGTLWLIDLNDWPSYGRCRSAAATAIAGYLDVQAARKACERRQSP